MNKFYLTFAIVCAFGMFSMNLVHANTKKATTPETYLKIDINKTTKQLTLSQGDIVINTYDVIFDSRSNMSFVGNFDKITIDPRNTARIKINKSVTLYGSTHLKKKNHIKVADINQLITDIVGGTVKWDKHYTIRLPSKISVTVH